MGSMPAEQVNAQALSAASSAVNDSVVAATLCEQVTTDMQMKAAGVGGATRGMAKFGMGLGKKMMPSVGKMADGLEGGGLPKRFILAITSNEIVALEEKEKDDTVSCGKVLKSWPREGFTAQVQPQNLNQLQGVPADRQILTLYLPLTGSGNKYLEAAGSNIEAAGSPGMPTRFMIALDEPSQAVVKEIATQGGGPTVMMGGQVVSGGMGMPGQPDSTAQLEKLAQLHQSGALTDAEFEAQKAKIIGG
jgi:hypothetical protein